MPTSSLESGNGVLSFFCSQRFYIGYLPAARPYFPFEGTQWYADLESDNRVSGFFCSKRSYI